MRAWIGVLVSVCVLLQPVAVAEVKVRRAVFNEGTVTVMVKDHIGKPLPKADVKLLSKKGKALQSLKTDAKGECSLEDVETGRYRLVVADRLMVPFHVSSKGKVSKLLVMVPDRPPYGAGQFGHGLGFWLTNPWVIAGIVATAIAVPVAIHNSDDNGNGHGQMHP
jgi:hypothetical protein